MQEGMPKYCGPVCAAATADLDTVPAPMGQLGLVAAHDIVKLRETLLTGQLA